MFSTIKEWPAENVEKINIDLLVPYARNSRTHSDAQVAQIAASMKEWGWTSPVLVDESNRIIAGHGRVLAARQLGIDKIPCVIAKGWSEPQIKAYVLADNQLATNAGWDMELLKLELADLSLDGFDLDLLGFDNLADLMNDPTEGLTDPDDVPDAPKEPVTVLGDVWIMGGHRIVCGDSTSADVVEKALAGVKPHLMVTDPPYGVEYDPEWRAKAGVNKNKDKMGVVLNDDKADWSEAWALFPGDVAYVWHGGLQAGVVADSLSVSGFVIRSQIVWAKDRFALSRGDYHWRHEPCWYAVKKTKTGHWAGDRKQDTIWNIPCRDDKGVGHSTQKPVECMKRPIENNSSPGQAVYEPFSGSGTTIIAAEMTGRKCHAIELNPPYVDIAVIRWQEFTGQTATLEGDGRTFTEIAESRNVPLCTA